MTSRYIAPIRVPLPITRSPRPRAAARWFGWSLSVESLLSWRRARLRCPARG